jgi:SAM-dependent methyltransferase/RimJ/RimL family protein N-acetyltransferase
MAGRILTDGDLRLRPADLALDPPLALPWYQDPEVLLYSEGGAGPYDLSEVEAMFSHLAAQGELYIIETLRDTGWLPIGDVTLTGDDLPMVIGDAGHRSRGLGRRVLALVVQRARELGWGSVRVKSVYTCNARARRLFEGAGFRLVDTTAPTCGTPCWSFELTLEGAPGAWQHEAFVREVNLPWLDRIEKHTTTEVDWLVQALGARPGQKLLDIGCGLGRHVRELACRGYDVVGVDISPVLIAEASRRAGGVGPGRVSFRQMDMGDISVCDEFDHAYCLFESGFGRLGDDQRHVDFLRRVRTALRPGGRFALGVRNLYRWVAHRHAAFDPIHARMVWTTGDLAGTSGQPYGLRDTVRGFTPPEIALLASMAGLAVHSRYGVERIGQIRPEIRLDDIELITVLEKRTGAP